MVNTLHIHRVLPVCPTRRLPPSPTSPTLILPPPVRNVLFFKTTINLERELAERCLQFLRPIGTVLDVEKSQEKWKEYHIGARGKKNGKTIGNYGIENWLPGKRPLSTREHTTGYQAKNYLVPVDKYWVPGNKNLTTSEKTKIRPK